MYQYKRISAFLLLIAILSVGCRKDTLEVDIDRINPIVQTNIESTIKGYVTDKEGLPIVNAFVYVINQLAETNENGYFEITGLVGKQQAVIKVTKETYFSQFKALIPNKDVIDRTRIRLIEKTILK